MYEFLLLNKKIFCRQLKGKDRKFKNSESKNRSVCRCRFLTCLKFLNSKNVWGIFGKFICEMDWEIGIFGKV